MSTVPIFDGSRAFRCWRMDEIYKGPNTGRYVPNIDDLVIDWNTGFYRVTEVDRVSGLSVLTQWNVPTDVAAINEENQLFGVDIAAQAESFKAYLDQSVTPHILALDRRLHVFGTTASTLKVFQGTDISRSGRVISAMYDQYNTFLGENIPLELVVMPDQNNVGVKAPMVGYTLQKLQDGEVVTAVIYDDAGHACSYSKLLIQNSSFIRTTDANKKYVSGIYLESPFLDKRDDRLLQFPTNMTVRDLPVTGVVKYSDGSIERYPANGGKFNLYGIDHYITTIVGQKFPLVLSYKLAENEYCYGATPSVNRHISEKYWGTTTEFEKAYSIKLYAFPRWVDGVTGYTLDFYVYTLDRAHVYCVTPYVSVSVTSPPFYPMQYGVKQKLTFIVEMDKVDPRYPPFKFVQTMEITLVTPGTYNGTNWLVGFSPNQMPMYGEKLTAQLYTLGVNNDELDLSNGFHSKEEWLRHVYYKTEPLHNYNIEHQAPAPNLFRVKLKQRDYLLSIEEWDKRLKVINDLKEGENVLIQFIYRTNENDLQLSIAALPLHRANSV